jgi:hypothetical protein
MAIVTGLKAERMLEIEAASVVNGVVDSAGDLILTTHGGDEINAGHVKGETGDDAQAVMSVTDSASIDLTLTGTGTVADPWNISAAVKDHPAKLLQLAGDNIGPGPSYVTDIGTGLGTKYGPYDWDGKFEPAGNPLVRLAWRDGDYRILGHADGNSIGTPRCIVTTPNIWTAYALRNGALFGPLNEYVEATLTPAGIVVLQGLFQTRIAQSAGTAVLCILPADMRPDTTMSFPVNVSDTVGELRIYPDGRVMVYTAMAAGNYITISMIAFPAAGVATWTPIPTANFLSGWSDYGDPQFGVPRYWVDPYGIVWWAGLLKVGTATSGTHMFVVPPAITNVDSHHVTLGSGTTFTCVRVSGSITAAIAGATGGAGYADYLAGPAAGNYVSLGGLTTLSPAALTILSWDNLYSLGRFANSYTAYNTAVGQGNQQPIITKRPDGLVMNYGLMATGTIAGAAFMYPERMLPPYTLIQQGVSNQARARVDIHGRQTETGTGLRAFIGQQGTTPWFSMDNLKWVAGVPG